MAGHHDAHLGRAIVDVQTQRDRAAEYRDRWLRDLRRSAPPRCGPYRAARLPRPARQPPSRSMPALDRIPTNERLCDPRLHGRNAGTPRGTTGLLAYSWRGAARRRDCAPRPADRAERRLRTRFGRTPADIADVLMRGRELGLPSLGISRTCRVPDVAVCLRVRCLMRLEP